MKSVLMVIFSLAVVSAIAQANDKWKMTVNKKVIAEGTPDNEEAVVKLESAAIVKMGGTAFTLQYTQAEGGNGWNRTIEFTDATGKSIHTVQIAAASGNAVFPLTLLKKHATTKTPLFIYTTSLPKDKKKAAVVRVRRLLLCKIEWI